MPLFIKDSVRFIYFIQSIVFSIEVFGVKKLN